MLKALFQIYPDSTALQSGNFSNFNDPISGGTTGRVYSAV